MFFCLFFLLHLEIGQIREQWMSAFIQCFVYSLQHAWQVHSEGPKQDGKLPSLLRQVFEQLEEGGEDPVVQSAVLCFYRQLFVFLHETSK